MITASHRQKGFVAALVHRLAGLALAIFLPVHFLALGTALKGAEMFDTFLAATHHPLVKASEFVLVIALAIHMALGLRVLAIEFFDFRERSLAPLTACAAAAAATGLLFLLNAG
jgi:succinate dehydrogenase subunit D